MNYTKISRRSFLLYCIISSIITAIIARPPNYHYAWAMKECKNKIFNITNETNETLYCCKCPPSTYMQEDCSKQNESNHTKQSFQPNATKCKNCTFDQTNPSNQSYMDDYNNAKSCKKSIQCDKYMNTERIVGSRKTGSRCDCVDGTFRENGNEVTGPCKRHQKCEEGYGVKKSGTNITDTVCEKCTYGTVSYSVSSTETCTLNGTNSPNITMTEPMNDCKLEQTTPNAILIATTVVAIAIIIALVAYIKNEKFKTLIDGICCSCRAGTGSSNDANENGRNPEGGNAVNQPLLRAENGQMQQAGTGSSDNANQNEENGEGGDEVDENEPPLLRAENGQAEQAGTGSSNNANQNEENGEGGDEVDENEPLLPHKENGQMQQARTGSLGDANENGRNHEAGTGSSDNANQNEENGEGGDEVDEKEPNIDETNLSNNNQEGSSRQADEVVVSAGHSGGPEVPNKALPIQPLTLNNEVFVGEGNQNEIILNNERGYLREFIHDRDLVQLNQYSNEELRTALGLNIHGITVSADFLLDVLKEDISKDRVLRFLRKSELINSDRLERIISDANNDNPNNTREQIAQIILEIKHEKGRRLTVGVLLKAAKCNDQDQALYDKLFAEFKKYLDNKRNENATRQ